MKQMIYLLTCLPILLTSCREIKTMQTIEFPEIAPQNLMDEFLELEAQATSGLAVVFESRDTSIVVIKDNRAEFLQTGVVEIIARQPGNEVFYEAPHIKQTLAIRDWDSNKKIQTLEFELPEEWIISAQGIRVPLTATSSSGLSVKFASDNELGEISYNHNFLYLYHGTYEADIRVTAYQDGNDEYNPAENVTRIIHIIGDVTH